MPAGVRLRELGPPRTDDSSGWERVLRAGGANPPLSVFLGIHGTAGPGVTLGRVLSLHCPSLSHSDHPETADTGMEASWMRVSMAWARASSELAP